MSPIPHIATKSNPFEKHGIDHLSASSCNLFAAAPALWCMERLLGLKAPVGAAAHRGTAIEAGVSNGLLRPWATEDECVDVAEQQFRNLIAFSGDPKQESEGKAVAPTVRVALAELRKYGNSVTAQEKIEWRAEGVPVPFIGYVDYRFTTHQILIDLKTQLRLASEIKTPHARQVASYAGAYSHNIDARICYATPQKCAVYQLENGPAHVAALSNIGRTIGRFLAKSDDAKELALLLAPDVDSFYMNDPKTRQMAFDLWGV